MSDFKPFKCAGCGRFFASRQSLGLHWAHERKKPGRGCIVGVVTVDDARAQRIRDIVAQQWAVAIAVIGCTLTKSDGTPTDPDDYFANVWAKCLTQVQGQIVEWLPSAAEIVGGEP